MLRLGLDKAGVQCWLDQFDLVWVGTVDGDRHRQAIGLHDSHDLAAFALLGLTHGGTTPFGGGEGAINETLAQVEPAARFQITGEIVQYRREHAGLNPDLKPVMAGRLGWIRAWQIRPSTAGAQDIEHTVQDGARPSRGGPGHQAAAAARQNTALRSSTVR